MPNPQAKYHDNVPGKWYVDDTCIDCDLCNDLAAKNFKGNDDEGHSLVFKQPEGEEELKQSQEAKESCPVGAIGDDGA